MDTPETPETPKESQDTEQEGVKKRGRYRKNPRRALEEICDRLEKAVNSPGQKVAKSIDGLKQVAAIRLRLLDVDAETKHNETVLENETLKAQHEKDTAEIARLRTSTRHYEPVTVQDPETPKLQRQVQELSGLVQFLASEITDPHARACIAIKAVLKWGSGARPVFDALNLDIRFYYQGLQGNPSAESLQQNLSRCSDPDSENAVYIRAALEVLFQVKVAKPVRRVRNSDTRDFASLCPPGLFEE